MKKPKLSAARSDIYTVEFPDGHIEENVTGYMWDIKNEFGYVEYYFDKYPHIGFQVDWVDRYNNFHGQEFRSKKMLIEHLGGKEGFRKFKHEYVKAKCPKVNKTHFYITQRAPLNGWRL